MTLPTWAPLFTDTLSNGSNAWKASRAEGDCGADTVPDAKPHLRKGSTRTYGCTLPGERIITLETPDGKTIPMADNQAYRAANLSALQNRAKVTRDSINYFPPSATRAGALTFFPDLASRARPVDEVELSNQRACLGRL